MTFIKQQSKVRGQASAGLEQLIQSTEISDYCESLHFEARDITALLASSGLHSMCGSCLEICLCVCKTKHLGVSLLDDAAKVQ